MKLFKVEKPHVYFLEEDGSYGLVRDINESDIFYLVDCCLNEKTDEKTLEIDPLPSEDDCPNLAEKVIYDELKKQFETLITEKAKISKDIDALFEDAVALYSAENSVETPEEWVSES